MSRHLDHTFEGYEGVTEIADSIVVFGKTSEEHDRTMNDMLRQCQAIGLKLINDL